MDDKLFQDLIQSLKEETFSGQHLPDEKQEIKQESGKKQTENDTPITEYVGSAIGDTVGLVIANLQADIRKKISLPDEYRSIGIVSSRTGGGPHVMAADEAVKATNTIMVSIEFARDTKGGAGHGSTVIFASRDVSDSRRAVEVMLGALDRCFGDVYVCDVGHIELHYTARASYALQMAFQAPVGQAFGIVVGAPAAVGMIMTDRALKTAQVDISTYASPGNGGTAHSNEIIVSFSGDSGAVKQSLLAARDTGLNVLRNMGQNPKSMTAPVL